MNQIIFLSILFSFVSSSAILQQRLKYLEQLQEMDKKLQVYENFIHSHVQNFQDFRFLEKAEESVKLGKSNFSSQDDPDNLYPVPKVGPLGINCTTFDCKGEQLSFMKNIQQKFVGADGIDGPQGDQGEPGNQGLKGDQGLPGKDAVVPSEAFLDYIALQAVQNELANIANFGSNDQDIEKEAI